jgi:hypothetical protein
MHDDPGVILLGKGMVPTGCRSRTYQRSGVAGAPISIGEPITMVERARQAVFASSAQRPEPSGPRTRA